MPKDPSIYDLLAKQNISDLTVENLDKATKNSAIDPSNVEFWSGVITIARAMEESRTFSHGLPIPEMGVVQVETIADGANTTITPTGSEVWLILNVDVDSCSFALKDADGNINPLDFTQIRPQTPLYLSSTMSLYILNASGSGQTPSIAYFKVAL